MEQNIYIKNETYYKKKTHKAHHYRVIDFGEANYNFDKKSLLVILLNIELVKEKM
ncbi:hypothetical protein CBLAS_1044 [Campylobacter blaseri]|uniref:hypothetical protein n=1 Tax=Campylobacter blaseri TaxID=2042961 RepID=UPI001C206AEF|nr:hypothetical protein [Campylobacter blaseri]QKF86222.1 hypothetical protein CBLAS_1044 [Campylobacter blaseri]